MKTALFAKAKALWRGEQTTISGLSLPSRTSRVLRRLDVSTGLSCLTRMLIKQLWQRKRTRILRSNLRGAKSCKQYLLNHRKTSCFLIQRLSSRPVTPSRKEISKSSQCFQIFQNRLQNSWRVVTGKSPNSRKAYRLQKGDYLGIWEERKKWRRSSTRLHDTGLLDLQWRPFKTHHLRNHKSPNVYWTTGVDSRMTQVSSMAPPFFPHLLTINLFVSRLPLHVSVSNQKTLQLVSKLVWLL